MTVAQQVLLIIAVICFAIGAVIGTNGTTAGLAGRLNWISAGLAFTVASFAIG